MPYVQFEVVSLYIRMLGTRAAAYSYTLECRRLDPDRETPTPTYIVRGKVIMDLIGQQMCFLVCYMEGIIE